MKGNKRKIQGITLVSLVITIILLLILAGITIATLTGENGLFARAQRAKIKSQLNLQMLCGRFSQMNLLREIKLFTQ